MPLPLFVVGCDRSGTTLLTSLLEAGFGLAAPLETHFIPYFGRGLFLWGDLGGRERRRRLAEAIFDFLEILTVSNYPTKELTDLEPVTLLAVRGQLDALVDDAVDFGGLMQGIFDRFAAQQGRAGWVDNSSFYESLPLALWQTHLPGMRVIHIVRDGRDVALSWMKSWWGPATLGEAAWLWSRHVRDKRAWGVAHPEQYLELHYEELLTQPRETLARVAGFLGVSLPEGPIDLSASPAARVLSTGGTHDLLAGPVKADNREKWRAALSDDQQRLFEYFAGETLREGGYPIRFAAMSWSERLFIWPRALLSLGKRFVTPVYYAKKAKWGVPLALRLAGPLSGMLVRLVTGRNR
ncbi:MAG: sulfotransferase [Magnetococcus sp. YQC-9]